MTYQKRDFSPKQIWKPLGQLKEEHHSLFLSPERAPLWELRKQIWNGIEKIGKDTENGLLFGSLKLLNTFRYIEGLVISPDEYFNLAAFVVSQPLLEDLIHLGGLKNLVEDFFLKTYGLPVHFHDTEWHNVASIRIPNISERISVGHPSTKKIMRDFNRLTKDIWLVTFDVRQKGAFLNFVAYIPPVDMDDPDVNKDMINRSAGYINQMKVSV